MKKLNEQEEEEGKDNDLPTTGQLFKYQHCQRQGQEDQPRQSPWTATVRPFYIWTSVGEIK